MWDQINAAIRWHICNLKNTHVSAHRNPYIGGWSIHRNSIIRSQYSIFWTFGYSDKILGIGARRQGKHKILDTVCNKPHLTKKLTVPQTLQPLDLAFCSDVVHKSSNPIVIHLAQRRIWFDAFCTSQNTKSFGQVLSRHLLVAAYAVIKVILIWLQNDPA